MSCFSDKITFARSVYYLLTGGWNLRADRLVAILLLLQRHGTRSAPQLAKHLEVSERTILRDIGALSTSGVPIYAERGPNGGFRLVEGYSLDLTGLRSPEVRTFFLHGIDGVLEDLGWYQDAQTARDKLTCAIPEEQKSVAAEVTQRLYVDETPWFSREDSTPFLSILQDAIWKNRRLNMSYKNPNGTVSSRLLEPYALVAKTGIWYLVAERDTQLRVYRVSRITHVDPLDEHFERPTSFDLVQFWSTWTIDFESSLRKYEVLLWVKNDYYKTFVRTTPFPVDRDIQIQPDVPRDYVAVRVTFETMEIACHHILGYGGKVHVVEPLDLRNLVIERARQILTASRVFQD
jgi:predicted DNA-binding transcriptional regulator YafY